LQTPRLVFLLAGLVERRFLMLEASAIGYCCPLWLCRRTKGKTPSDFLYLDLQLVMPGSCQTVSSQPRWGQRRTAWPMSGGKGFEEVRKHSGVLETDLKVAGAGLDNSTWVRASAESLASEVSLRLSRPTGVFERGNVRSRRNRFERRPVTQTFAGLLTVMMTALRLRMGHRNS
jgi:hypothetical protein